MNSEIFPDSPRFCIPTDYTHVLASSISDQEPLAHGYWVIRPASFAGPVVMSNILSHCLHHCISAQHLGHTCPESHMWRETLETPSQRTGNLGHLAPNKPSSYFLLAQGPGLGGRLAEVQVQMLQRPISPCLPTPSLFMSHAAVQEWRSACIFRDEEFAPLTCFFKVWEELAARLLVALPMGPLASFLCLSLPSYKTEKSLCLWQTGSADILTVEESYQFKDKRNGWMSFSNLNPARLLRSET